MSDDVFDQLVDDILSNPDENDLDDEDDDDAEPGDSKASPMSSVEVNALDESDTDDDEDAPAKEPTPRGKAPLKLPPPTKPNPASKPMSVTDDDSGVSSGDSSVVRDSKKDKTATLPLSTAPGFDHPDYTIERTISMISARRVFFLGALEKSNGRSKEGEQLVQTIENDLKAELRFAAGKRGAHAVVGVTLAITIADGLLVGTASGTPVRLRKRDE